jgi:hypothetical protein
MSPAKSSGARATASESRRSGQLLADLVLEGAQREVHAAGRPLARREHAARGGEARGEEVRAGQDVVGAVLHHEADGAGLLLGERGDLLVGAPHRGHRGATRELGLLDLDRQQQALGAQVLDEGDGGRALALEGAVADRLVDLGVDRHDLLVLAALQLLEVVLQAGLAEHALALVARGGLDLFPPRVALLARQDHAGDVGGRHEEDRRAAQHLRGELLVAAGLE